MAIFKSRVRTALVVVAVAVIAVAGAVAFNVQATFKKPAPAKFAAPKDATEANLQDLAYVRTLTAVDRSFSAESKAAFQKAIDALAAQAASLDRASLEMGISKAAALAGNGHTNVLGADWGYALNSIPLRTNWFADGLYVVQADPALADLLGAKVLSVAGRTPEALAEALAPYIGGPESFKRHMAINLMESPGALHGAGLAPAAEELSLTLLLKDGQAVERVLAAVPEPVNGAYKLNQARVDPQRYLSPVRRPADERTWVHVLDSAETLPPYLQQPEKYYWSTYLGDSSVLYVQINATRNQSGALGNRRDSGEGAAVDSMPLQAFLNQVLEDARAKKPRHAVIDLRFNAGGNSALTNAFTKALPQAISADGKIFVVTSANTFSAGIITTAWLKYYAGPRGVIVGQRIGDDEQFWAEGAKLVLPNSGIMLEYATAYHDWQNGCSVLKLTTCYFFNFASGVAAGSLSPTLPAVPTFQDYLAGRDTAVDAIAGAIGKSL